MSGLEVLVAFARAKSERLAIVPHELHPVARVAVGRAEPALIDTHGRWNGVGQGQLDRFGEEEEMHCWCLI